MQEFDQVTFGSAPTQVNCFENTGMRKHRNLLFQQCQHRPMCVCMRVSARACMCVCVSPSPKKTRIKKKYTTWIFFGKVRIHMQTTAEVIAKRTVGL